MSSTKSFGTRLALSGGMLDLMWIVLTIAFFALSLSYVSGCSRL
ncbi:MAG TPA: hypothetical protein VGI47_05305 [Candidatus Binataceae bacterium]|jgi:hypothetical protein